MTVIPATRVNYFDRQHLRLAEFRDEQAYHIALRRRHNLSHHSWGIVNGLAIVLQDGVPVVQPGMAIDGYGRELLRIERYTIDRTVFDRYGTARVDVWLEYELGAADANAPANRCDPVSPNQQYRAIESAHVTIERAMSADVDARSPQAVPVDALASKLPDTPDDPKLRWPVYLGRVSMKLGADGKPTYTIEQTALAYIGLNAELIDHPANPSRIEIGHSWLKPASVETRNIAGTSWTYQGEANRAFAVFVPTATPATALVPTISVTGGSTQIIGTTEVHGDLVLDGTTLVLPEGVPEANLVLDENAAIYRVQVNSADELRIDLGDTSTEARKLMIGLTKDGKFNPILEISAPTGGPPQLTVHGDLHVEGALSGPDIRLRTLSQDLIPQLAAMLQVGVLTGSS